MEFNEKEINEMANVKLKPISDEVMEALCHSIENDLDRWEISTNTLKDLKTGINYWINTKYISSTWINGVASEVFFGPQCESVFVSMQILADKKSSLAQQVVINSILPQCSHPFDIVVIHDIDKTPWWKFWS